MAIRNLTAGATFLSFAVGVASLYAQPAANVLTWHNDHNRSGANNAESTLTLSNVNATTFGKVGFFSTDGEVDAEPLSVGGLKIGGTTHNVVFIASEHDTVYADDAATGEVLWQTSLLKSGETPGSYLKCDEVLPEIGVTSTPVIDLSEGPNGAIYLVSMTIDASDNYHQRLNALDITTGGQLFGGPQEVTASYPGNGPNSNSGKLTFIPKHFVEHAGLLDWNGGIYLAWTSHCDISPYSGWVMGYDAGSLKQTSVLNLTPNGTKGAIWMSGAGMASTPTKILFLDANGTFDTTLDSNGFPASQDFGNAFLELEIGSTGNLQVKDYYATDNTVAQSGSDIDLGSGGAMLLPVYTDASGNSQWLAVGAGKDHNIYVVQQNNMGKYHPNGGYVYQVLTGALPKGEWGAPAFWNNTVYYGGRQDSIKAFSIVNAKLVPTPAAETANAFAYPGTIPSISSQGASSAIVWAISHSKTGVPDVLYAYNAANLAQELYDSNQSGTRDQFGSVQHFITPMISNGRVYVGTNTGVAVFGLLGN